MNSPVTARQRRFIELADMLAGEFAERAGEHGREASFPFENYERMAAAGYLGLTVPEELGDGRIARRNLARSRALRRRLRLDRARRQYARVRDRAGGDRDAVVPAAIRGPVMDTVPDERLAATRAVDPRWTLYRSYRSRRNGGVPLARLSRAVEVGEPDRS